MDFRNCITPSWTYFKTLLKWIFVSVCVGITAGGAGILFHASLGVVEGLFKDNSVLIYLLPLLGLIIVWLYKTSRMENHKGTDGIFLTVRNGEKVSVFLAPLIFVSTLLTHLGGGSAGREGAALQIGGSLGSFIGKTLRLNENDLKVITLCGMSATFCGLFGTPLTAALFSLEVINVGVFYYAALVPVVISSFTAFLMLKYLNIPIMLLAIKDSPSDFVGITVFQVAVLGLLCAGVSIIWCIMSEKGGEILKKKLPNSYVRVFVCAALVVAMTLLSGSNDYNGAGMNLVIKAVSGEHIFMLAFLVKMVFTIVTLKGGMRGGEIVPTFAIGALFGSVVSPLLGLDPSFASAIGMVAVFCGSVNCPISSMALSIEMFGSQHLLYFAIASSLSYMISGKYSLYSSQKIVFSKLEPVPMEEEEAK